MEPQPEQQVAEGAAQEEAVKKEEQDAPPAKKQRTEEAAQEPDDRAPAAAEPAAVDGKPAESSVPKKIGYKTFQTGSECYKYYQNLVGKLRKNQNLNEYYLVFQYVLQYEFHMVKELVRQGHPDAERKLGGGLRAVQVRETDYGGSRTTCFFLIHNDNREEDVSYRKCVANLFPEMADLTAHYKSGGAMSPKQGKHGSGGGNGRGRGGGRGGGRGRGRGRGRR